MKCPTCGREMIAHLTTPTYRCASCKVTHSAKQMIEKHQKSFERLAKGSDE